MNAARDAILGRVRTALADRPAVASTLPGYRQSGETDPAALTAAFAERARAYKVRVEMIDIDHAPAAISGLLRARGCRRMLIPDGFPAALVPDDIEPLPGDADRDIIDGADGVLTLCACAIAQTGTVVLDHGHGQGSRVLTLLPDYHLCVVQAGQLVDLVPEAVARLEPAVRSGRPLTFISGPSATSDIELSRVEGVHGPRTVDIVVITGGP